MNSAKQGARTRIAQRSVITGCLILIFAVSSIGSFAQPAALSPPELDQLVARIALYPDPLLANILSASTYWTKIPEAEVWADQHSYLKGDALAQAMPADHFQWDLNIMALLPFPSVLDTVHGAACGPIDPHTFTPTCFLGCDRLGRAWRYIGSKGK